MPENKMWNIEWTVNALNETKDEAAPVLKNLFTDITAPLDIEERMRVRRILQYYAVYANQLANDVAMPDPIPSLPFWRKILRKK